jgi:hypothetical protein
MMYHSTAQKLWSERERRRRWLVRCPRTFAGLVTRRAASVGMR